MLSSKEIVLTTSNQKENFLKFNEKILKLSIRDERGNTGRKISFFGPIQQYNLNLENFSENIDIVMASGMIAKVPYTQYSSINLIFSSLEYLDFYKNASKDELNKKYCFEFIELIAEKGKYNVELTCSQKTLIKETYHYKAVKPDLTKNYSCAEIKLIKEKTSDKIINLDIRFYMDCEKYKTLEDLSNKIEEILNLNKESIDFQWEKI